MWWEGSVIGKFAVRVLEATIAAGWAEAGSFGRDEGVAFGGGRLGDGGLVVEHGEVG